MIDLNKAPAYFAILHHETGSHDEAIKRLAALYYQRGMNLKEIGDILGVTESRVCQLRGQAVRRLQLRLRT